MRTTLEEAVKHCGPWDQHGFRGKCQDCRHTAIFHCRSCMIQVTGCLCTAKDKMTPEEYEAFKQQQGEIRSSMEVTKD